MGRGIIKLERNGEERYLEWSTVVDAPVTHGMTLDELHNHVFTVQGEEGLRLLPDRLARIEETGVSFHGRNLADMISYNRAGPNESKLTEDQIWEHYCVRGPGPQPELQGSTVNPSVRGGRPVIEGSRCLLTNVLVELSNDFRITEIANDMDLNVDNIKQALLELARVYEVVMPKINISLLENIGVIFPARTGIVYSNQVGGTGCQHPTMEGFYVPLSASLPSSDPFLDRMLDNYTHSDMGIVRSWIDSLGFSRDFDAPEPKEVHEAMGVCQIAEAWIPIKVKGEGYYSGQYGPFADLKGRVGILTYPNSD